MNTDTPHGHDLDPAGAVLAALSAAHRSLSAVIDRELRAACGLSLAEADVLATLTRGPDGPQRLADLPRQISASNPGVTHILDPLVPTRPAPRQSSATDRRPASTPITSPARAPLAHAPPLPS